MINVLNKFWTKHFDGVDPVAYELKHLLQDRWVRFHSLPESKRYPENESEYQEVLHRYNQILRELFGVKSQLFVVLPEYSENKISTKPAKRLRQLFKNSQYWRSVERYEELGEEFYWHLHVASISYSGYELNALLRLVANDGARNCFVISESASSLFHPYDGGSDSILASTELRDELKGKYENWLSNYPGGF